MGAALSFLFLVGLWGGAMAKPAWPTLVAPRATIQGGLRYFGLAAIDCGYDDPLDSTSKTNYADEVAAFSNLAHICPFAIDEDLRPRLAQLNARGLAGLLYVEHLLFEQVPDAGLPSGYRLVLAPKAKANWNAFLAASGGTFHNGQVAAVYLVDEPAWHALAPQELALAASWIEASLPHIPALIIEGPYSVERLVLPPSIDWVGFDQYGVVDPSQDPMYLANLAALEAKLTRQEQRLVLVPDTLWLPEYSQLGLTPELMGEVTANYLLLALSQPRVVALIGYLWPGGMDSPSQLGARQLPPVAQEKIAWIGRFITHK